MKKLGIVIILAIMSTGLFAQTQLNESYPPNTVSTAAGINLERTIMVNAAAYAAEGCITFHNGRAVMIKNNRADHLTGDIVLGNGARVSPSGVMTFRDGSSTIIRPDQGVRMDGSVIGFDLPTRTDR